VRQRNRRIHFQSGFFGSFDVPWSEWSWINLFNKETQNPFSDSFGLKNPILDFLKETHPKVVSTDWTQWRLYTRPRSRFSYTDQKGLVNKVFIVWRKQEQFTVIPVKPWTPEKISGMFIVSRPIRSEMKLKKITAKLQQALVTTWFETTSWLFLPTNWLLFRPTFKNRTAEFGIDLEAKFTTV